MIVILRLGHRLPRDERISTHVGLAARAFGAEKMIYTGQKDSGLEESMKKIAKEWGGNFSIEYQKNGLKVLNEFKKDNFSIVHLTMYGLKVQDEIKKIRKEKNLLVIVGGPQVPGEYYELSDWNLSVTTQPHSEVSSLAIFLHEYFQGKEFEKDFKGRKKIIPSEKNKKIITE